jgi:hypothetical protein
MAIVKHVLFAGVCLSKIKEYTKIIDGKKKGRSIYNVEIDMERDIWEIINYIKEGNYILT